MAIGLSYPTAVGRRPVLCQSDASPRHPNSCCLTTVVMRAGSFSLGQSAMLWLVRPMFTTATSRRYAVTPAARFTLQAATRRENAEGTRGDLGPDALLHLRDGGSVTPPIVPSQRFLPSFVLALAAAFELAAWLQTLFRLLAGVPSGPSGKCRLLH